MDLIKIAKIVSAHGLNGEVKIFPYTDDLNGFKEYNEIYIDGEELEIISQKIASKFIVLKLKGFDYIDDVKRLLNKDVFIDKAQMPSLEEGEYYIHELIAMEVFSEADELIGTVKDVMETSANHVLVVDHDGKEALIPFVKAFIKELDLKRRKIKVKLIEGIL
ncbi:MAG: ribosome maturation factor RimM [Eubacteriales bacterium]|uniref:ribosome maturation factor RimM n=1 Tax=Fenollaria sp. TaxID=1965292 RepID=UPI002A74AC1C|nr:ribosome maturation factor RimM [Fenollaria sp.]MDD7339032.1 ribosome maturation factor RimM [Eubacteriales bacterium]MDY3106489.1 ribosome maturation factor RimM [Fenollaria sp.]